MTRNERMISLRKQSGMTLKEVADRLGVSEATVQRYESNKIKNVPCETIEKYADIFGCSPSYIMGWDNSESTGTDDVYVRIKARRCEIGMTQKELATRCGYKDHTTINKMENGLVDMPLGRLRQIASALDMSFEELILGK